MEANHDSEIKSEDIVARNGLANMISISTLSPDTWKKIVLESNNRAMDKTHKYPEKEEKFFRDCLEYVNISCGQECACHSFLNSGVWVLRKDLRFDIFLNHYAQLWVRGSKKFSDLVNNDHLYPGKRMRNAVYLMREIKERWNEWDNNGSSLPLTVNRHRVTYFCEGSFGPVLDVKNKIRFQDSTGVYTSKFLSQVFPDIVVPFDTASRSRMRKFGYDALMLGDGDLRSQITTVLKKYGLTIDELRKFDSAPSSHWPKRGGEISGRITSISRNIDKLFYS